MINAGNNLKNWLNWLRMYAKKDLLGILVIVSANGKSCGVDECLD